VNPAIVFSLAGIAAIVWGSIVAVFNDWAARLMKRTQRIYGQRAADMMTPRYVRVIGICLVVGGALFIVLALTGVLPNHAVTE
jgi:preprotein translocase subunit SecY